MSVRTKYMTHLKAAFTGFAELETKAEGLADTMFTGVCELVEECGLDKALDAFASACKEIEKDFTGNVPQNWRSRKSEINRGLKLGLDPNKHDSFSKYRKATTKAAGGSTSGGGSSPKDPTLAPKTSDSAKPSAHVAEISKAVPDKVREKLNKVIENLAKLDEATALDVLTKCEGAIYGKLRKAGGRLSNVKAATS